MLTFFGKTEEGMKLGREEVHNSLDTRRNNKTQVFFFSKDFIAFQVREIMDLGRIKANYGEGDGGG